MGLVTYMDTTGTAIRTARSETSETAQSVVASTVGEHLAVGVPAVIDYFLTDVLVLVVGFIVLGLITPGKLRDLVFLENHAGAAMIAGSQQIALVCIVVSVVRASDNDLMMGLGKILVYGTLGTVLQAVSLLVLGALVPERFRDVVMGVKVRLRAMLAATTFIVIGVINAVTLSQMETTTTSRRWQALLLGSVVTCIACGLAYKLALLALPASLGRGDAVANSLIVAGCVATLGFGTATAKPSVCHTAMSFLGIECALGLLGGVSITALYWVFLATSESLRALVAVTFITGTLVGVEVPLLMTLLWTGWTSSIEDTGHVLVNLNAADYFGALVGGLIRPFVLSPTVGILEAIAIAGLIGATTTLIIAALLLKRMLSRQALVASVAVLVAALVGLVTLLAGIRNIETTARQSLYAQPIVFAKHSKYQDIVVTRFGGDRRLHLGGGLQYSSRSEYCYTESLVYPAMDEGTKLALTLGGGDGLAARELLRIPNIERIVQVDLDPNVIEVTRIVLREDSRGNLDNSQVEKITADAFTRLHKQACDKSQVQRFDAIYANLSNPDNAVLAKLYSQELYRLIHTVAALGTKSVMQSGSPFSTPQAFWRTDSSIRTTGWSTTSCHMHVPTFGDWGFVLAQTGPELPTFELYDGTPPLKFLTPDTARAATVFGTDSGPQQLKPSTLMHPRIVENIRRGWRQAEEQSAKYFAKGRASDRSAVQSANLYSRD